MSIILTKQGFDKINNELNRLKTNDRFLASKRIEETRPIGVVEDNPEYMQALEAQQMIENKIAELSDILANATIFEKNMGKTDKVSFGTTVTFVNCDTDEEKCYTIVSPYESDINNGFISYEAPFVKNMMGLQIGDVFDFNNIDYEIISIDYSVLRFE